jgi:hypothetical protein
VTALCTHNTSIGNHDQTPSAAYVQRRSQSSHSGDHADAASPSIIEPLALPQPLPASCTPQASLLQSWPSRHHESARHSGGSSSSTAHAEYHAWAAASGPSNASAATAAAAEPQQQQGGNSAVLPHWSCLLVHQQHQPQPTGSSAVPRRWTCLAFGYQLQQQQQRQQSQQTATIARFCCSSSGSVRCLWTSLRCSLAAKQITGCAGTAASSAAA